MRVYFSGNVLFFKECYLSSASIIYRSIWKIPVFLHEKAKRFNTVYFQHSFNCKCDILRLSGSFVPNIKAMGLLLKSQADSK